MNTEIRKEIREYILNDVNLTLSRLGVSEPVVEISEPSEGRPEYRLKSASIRQFPMMFKEAHVAGVMTAFENEPVYEYFRENTTLVVISLEFSFQNFRFGHNGAEIGRVYYLVENDLPKKFSISEDCLGGINDTRSMYVRKVKGLEI